MRAQLVFLGRAGGADPTARLRIPAPQVEDPVPLQLRLTERWSRQDVVRVIVGSDPTWADVVIVDEPLTIQREHARFYLNQADPRLSDFRAMKNCPALIDGKHTPPFEWVKLQAGSEIQLSCWRFRYEWTD